MQKAELASNGFNFKVKTVPGKGLPGRFIFPPFTVLRATDGEWLRRKRQWLALGIQSEIGRGENTTTYQIGNKTEWERGLLHQGKTIDTKNGEKWEGGESAWQNTGTSVFDPVLCELAYSWFCPPAGQIVDPFAGGSVRGIVATYMGYKYWGSELRPEQVEANKIQGKTIVPQFPPTWECGDAYEMLRKAPEADFIFSCPPYGNLEVYSALKEDISNMPYTMFIERYEKIIARACRRLKENRFACFVITNFRDKKTGIYYDFVGDTVRAFHTHGLHFYNDAILMTPTGSLPVRTGRQFMAGRKLGKAHQNILVFYKGDPKQIAKEFNT